MILYQLVKAVLDEIYAQIPLTCEEDKDEAILYELKILRDKYPELINGVTIDYSDCITRFAYVYRYVASHAFATYALIRDTPDLGFLFDMEKISVCCLGGGPGSDLLGIIKYMKTRNKSGTLMCRIYDKEKSWRESLGSICNQLTSFPIFPTFRTLDVTDGEAETKYPELLENNLFTMSFLMSELCSIQGHSEDFFINLFKHAKRNACFLFLDNRSGYSREWFDKLIKMHNQQGSYGRLHLIKRAERYLFQLEPNEKAEGLEPYYSKFGELGRSKFDEAGRPKSDPVIDYRIYRKE